MVQGRPPMGLEGTSPPTGDLVGGARASYGYDDAVGSLDDVRGFARARAGPSSSSGRAGYATNTRKRSDEARRFAASAAAAQGALTAELFGTGGGARGGARGGRSTGRYESPALRGPTAEQITGTDGFLEVFPRGNDRKPALLGQLESLLAEKLRLTEKLTESSGADAEATDALQLEAYRQTFEAFINAFSTYRPLLTRVKEHYDRALDRALRSERENATLRAELAASERRRAREVESTRAATNAKAANLRGDATKRALAAEARAAAAEAKLEEAIAREAAAEARAAAAVEAAAASEAARVDMRRAAEAEASWGQTTRNAERLLAAELGPVPKNFPRADVQLAEGEGGLSMEPRPESEDGGDPGDGAGADEGGRDADACSIVTESTDDGQEKEKEDPPGGE